MHFVSKQLCTKGYCGKEEAFEVNEGKTSGINSAMTH